MKTLSRRLALKLGLITAATLLPGCATLLLDGRRKEKMSANLDVLIVGGGPAGLSAGLTLGRLSRSALICDDGRPRNAPSAHVNNFVSRDGINPGEWRAHAKKDLEKYPTIRFEQATVQSVKKVGHRFEARLSTGAEISVRKMILAYGVIDQTLQTPGFRELWGKAIFHCPFCHGFEVRGSELALLSNSEMTFHSLPMIHSLASKLTLLTNGTPLFNGDQMALLKKKNIELIDRKISSFRRDGEKLLAVEFEDGRTIAPHAIFYGQNSAFQLKAEIGASLGCEKTPFGFYKINERHQTTVPGVMAAGDCASMAHSVLLAAASGVTAGAAAIFEMTSEDIYA